MRSYWDEFIIVEGAGLLDLPLRKILQKFWEYLKDEGVVERQKRTVEGKPDGPENGEDR